MINLLGAVYIAVILGIALFGFLGMLTIWFFWKHRDERFPIPAFDEVDLPSVTVQLPLYNERLVVSRLIHAAAALDYPRHLLEIQVLDDSDDETTALARVLVNELRKDGTNITLHHRELRTGFKAGALEAGLQHAAGNFIALFDADFAPEPNFLRQTIPHFMIDPSLGVVQTRWGHINAAESALTAAQSIALDKHFVMEQSVRHRANLFPKFNGSGGIWRRSCLEDAGGWKDDTVCEDLCLSTRAVLKGWKFRYLNGVVAPAELPRTIAAYKNQQARWAKGSTQCLITYGRSILASANQSITARLYATFSMAGYSVHLLMILLLLVQVPLILKGYKPPRVLIILAVLSLAQPFLFVFGQQLLYKDWPRRLLYLPALLIIAIGLAPSNCRAVLEALLGRKNDFIRTPKGKSNFQEQGSSPTKLVGYRLPFDWIVIFELLLALYASAGALICIATANYWPLLFMGACVAGFSYVAFGSIREHRAAREVDTSRVQSMQTPSLH